MWGQYTQKLEISFTSFIAQTYKKQDSQVNEITQYLESLSVLRVKWSQGQRKISFTKTTQLIIAMAA